MTPSTSSNGSAAATSERPPLADLLLAEAVRAYEEDGAATLRQPAAEAVARHDGGPNLEDRLVRRAAALSIADDVRRAVQGVRQTIGWIVLGAIALALIGGAGAARGALGAPSGAPVNFFWALASLLGVQTLLLLAWIVVVVVRPNTVNVSPLAGIVLAAARAAARRLHASRVHLAASQAWSGMMLRGAVGRWTFSAISHGLWVAANAGCLVLLVLLLSTKRYTFVWETTILSHRAYEPVTEAIASAPRVLGFPVPTREQIAASGHADLSEATARAWSGLLVGAMTAYGLVPRAVLLVLCLVARRRAAGRLRLDTSAPGYQVLVGGLFPSGTGEPARSPAAESGAEVPPRSAQEREPGSGPPALVGFEIDPPASSWPPRLHGTRFTDLGFADGREGRQHVVAALQAADEAPRLVVVVCALTTTPDRGVRAFLDAVGDATPSPVALVLTAGHTLRERTSAEGVERRVEDWRLLARDAGIEEPRVVEVDLDHLTDASQARLADLLGAAVTSESPRRLEDTFELIRAEASTWPPSPRERDQGELHRRIAAVHAANEGVWRRRLSLRGALSRDGAREMLEAARGVTALLPPRLRASPRWLAAGAVCGALGCVAAAALVSPVAIGALPAWSGLGAAVSAALAAAGGGRPAPPDEEDAGADYDRAVRAAALWAVLLELQGGAERGEAAISRVLEGTFRDEEPPVTAGTLGAWLDETRHRYDVALAEVGS